MNGTHPLEVYRFCPRCGSSDFPPAGDRSFRCAQCQFNLYVNAAAAVAALVVNEKNKLMLVTRGVEPDYGKLDLPGGFTDPGESAENAVVRELHEELGMKVKSVSYLGSAANEYVFSGLTVFTLDMAFKVIPESLNGLKPMDDILHYGFYDENEFSYNDIPAPSINRFVRHFFNRE